jgi:hypothetical protein
MARYLPYFRGKCIRLREIALTGFEKGQARACLPTAPIVQIAAKTGSGGVMNPPFAWFEGFGCDEFADSSEPSRE